MDDLDEDGNPSLIEDDLLGALELIKHLRNEVIRLQDESNKSKKALFDSEVRFVSLSSFPPCRLVMMAITLS